MFCFSLHLSFGRRLLSSAYVLPFVDMNHVCVSCIKIYCSYYLRRRFAIHENGIDKNSPSKQCSRAVEEIVRQGKSYLDKCLLSKRLQETSQFCYCFSLLSFTLNKSQLIKIYCQFLKQRAKPVDNKLLVIMSSVLPFFFLHA